MRALVTNPPGGWEHTSIEELPDPVPREGETLVDMLAAGINPADDFQVQGRYPGQPKPPFVIGRDGAGIVAEGHGTDALPAGTRVVMIQSTKRNLAEGTLATRQRIATDTIAAVPDGWSDEEAAAAALVYMTAWRAIGVIRETKAGDAVLVTGASGGVGTAAIQLAVGLGAKVVALSRSPDKQQRLRELGAHDAMAPDDPDLKTRVTDAVGKKGVDLVVENVGGPMLTHAVHLLGERGTVAVVGVLAGVEGAVPIPSLMFKRARIEGVLVSDDTPEEAQAAWRRIVEALGPRRPIVDAVYPFEEYGSAFDRLRSSTFGKIVLSMKPSP